MKTLENRLNFLTKYSIFTTVLMVMLFLFSFKAYKTIENFEELNVKRINIIEDDGTIRMVLSNKKLQHSGRMNGKDSEYRERHAGLLFFNDEGDECGGLIYGVENDGKGKDSGMSFTMDRYLNDQVIQLINNDYVTKDSTRSYRGLIVNDYPHGTNLETSHKRYLEINKIENKEEKKKQMQKFIKEEGGKNLLFVGKKRNNSQGLFINDKEGNPRLKIYVDKEGNPKIETIDQNGVIKDFIK